MNRKAKPSIDEIAPVEAWNEEDWAEMNASMQDAVSTFAGKLGVSGVQIGSTLIPAKKPPSVDKVVGCGDTFRVGDVVTMDGEGPYRVEAIHASDEGYGPGLNLRRIDDGPELQKTTGPISCYASGPTWKRKFKKLTQADVDTWFTKTKAPLRNGWHSVEIHPRACRFRTDNGVPVEIDRRGYPLKLVAEAVGRQTGYDLTMQRIYKDREKQAMDVKSATRRTPPRI